MEHLITIKIKPEDYERYKTMPYLEWVQRFYDEYDSNYSLRIRYQVFELYLDSKKPLILAHSSLEDEYLREILDGNKNAAIGG